MKRFTETGKWQKEWFQDLTPTEKCLWFYITDNCDPAGVFDGNFKMMTFCIGEKVTEDSLKAFGDRIEKLQNGKFWIVDFIEFQYGTLSKECRPQQKVFASIEKNKLVDKVFNTLSNTLSPAPEEILSVGSESENFLNSDNLSNRVSATTDRVFNTLEEEEEDKEEYKDMEKEGGVGETSEAEVLEAEVVKDDIFLPDEEFEGACRYLRTSRTSAFHVMQKNYQKSEQDIYKLLRKFLEQKIAMEQYKGKTQKELIDNFFYWIPKHLNHEPGEKNTSHKSSSRPIGKVQNVVNIASKVQFRGL